METLLKERDLSPPHTQEYDFSAMKLKVGDKLQVQPPAALSHEKYTVRLIGYSEGESILITPPCENGMPLPLIDGESLVVRSFSGQHAFGFSSTLEKICKVPFEYLHISYPKKVQGMMVREFPRIHTQVHGSVFNQAKGADNALPCVVSDLSFSGASISCQQPLGVKGDVLSLSIRIEPMGVLADLTLNALIRSVFEESSVKTEFRMHYGVEFQNVDSIQKMSLGSFIYEETLKAEKLP